MSNDGAMDRLKGKAKETLGKMTGDRRKASEGRTDQTKGKAKDTADDVRERAKGVKDSLSDQQKSGSGEGGPQRKPPTDQG